MRLDNETRDILIGALMGIAVGLIAGLIAVKVVFY